MKQNNKRYKNQYLLPTLLLFLTFNQIFDLSAQNIQYITVNNYQQPQLVIQLTSVAGTPYDECVITDCTFTECVSDQSGGGLYTRVNNNKKITVNGTNTFRSCSAFTGGGWYAIIFDRGKMLMQGYVTVTDCFSTQNGGDGGGGMSIVVTGAESLLTIEAEILFTNCRSSSQGGGMELYGNVASLIEITGKLTFNNCSCANGRGGGLDALRSPIFVIGFIQLLGEITCFNCSASTTGGTYNGCGGGVNFEFPADDTVYINKITCTDCKANEGGGLYFTCDNWNYLEIRTTYIFPQSMCFSGCEALTGSGGGICIEVHHTDVEFNPIDLESQILFDHCNAKLSGGGIYLQQGEAQYTNYNKMKFSECKATNGGGLFTLITGQGILTLSYCEFYQCQSNGGNGGGVYFEVNFAPVIQIKIQDTTIHDCEAITNSSSTYP
ncbi:MAG: hypothetical protein EZS28_044768, partial [Streblomastix strix]